MDKKIPEELKQKAHLGFKAVEQFEQGHEVTVECPVCGAYLEVTRVEAVNSMWVGCPNGYQHFMMHLQGGTP